MPSRSVTILHLDVDAETIGTNYRTDVAMVGDARPGLEALTRTAQHARPDLMPLSTDPCEVARLIDAAVGAPVVLIADGPQRSNRVLVGEMGSNRRAG